MHNKLAVLLICGSLAGGYTPGLRAQAADEKGWYGGVVAAGVANVKFDNNALPITGATASSLSKDQSASQFALIGGYDFSRNLAIEGVYAKPGKFSARRTMTAPGAGTLGATTDSSAWSLAGIINVPLDKEFYAFGKLGVAFTTTKTSLTTTGVVTLPAGTERNPEKSERNVLFGAGIGYDFSRNWGLRFDWTRVNNVGDLRTGESDFDSWTVGLKFRF